MSETVLDVKGLSCPLPVLKANKALRSLPAGARLTVLATDPASVKDFQAYARETGHALVSFSEGAGLYRFTLRKRKDTVAPAAD
ncbi:sulfurtransferase TusA family protein [Roseomonas gilardii]|uniref:sulfurtransferase TusA family protein n=1 Tax=Roseomonas gilardii TaxID=257708 RepID=UPI0011A293A1|nr:sulfurtransferase TusA family protein [Roseomonas gilardii]